MCVPPNGWFIRENHVKMDDVGCPYFRQPPFMAIATDWNLECRGGVRIPRPKECPPGTKILKKPWENVTFKFRIGSGTFALDRFRGLFCGNLHVIWKWVPHIECLQPKVTDRSTNPKFKKYINIRGVLYTLGLAHRMPPKSSKMSSFTCIFRFFFAKLVLKDCINWLFSYECNYNILQ